MDFAFLGRGRFLCVSIAGLEAAGGDRQIATLIRWVVVKQGLYEESDSDVLPFVPRAIGEASLRRPPDSDDSTMYKSMRGLAGRSCTGAVSSQWNRADEAVLVGLNTLGRKTRRSIFEAKRHDVRPSAPVSHGLPRSRPARRWTPRPLA